MINLKMRKLILLMTVAAIGAQAYADGDIQYRNYAKQDTYNKEEQYSGYDKRAKQQRSAVEQQHLIQIQQQEEDLVDEATIRAKAKLEKIGYPQNSPIYKGALRNEIAKQREEIIEQQEGMRAERQRTAPELRQNARTKAVYEEEQDLRYIAPARRAQSPEFERERVIQQEEKMRAEQAYVQRRRTLADREEQGAEELQLRQEQRMLEDEKENQRPRYSQKRYREDVEDNSRINKKRKLYAEDEELIEEKGLAQQPAQEKESAVDKVKKYATKENMETAKDAVAGIGSTLSQLKGLFG